MPEESPFSLIETLKKIGEELKGEEKADISQKVSKPEETPPKEEKEKKTSEEVKIESEILSQDWQEEIKNERQKLEKVYREVEDLRRKIQRRLDRIKRLEVEFLRVRNELTHFDQIKKEDQILLEEINKYFKKSE